VKHGPCRGAARAAPSGSLSTRTLSGSGRDLPSDPADARVPPEGQRPSTLFRRHNALTDDRATRVYQQYGSSRLHRLAKRCPRAPDKVFRWLGESQCSQAVYRHGGERMYRYPQLWTTAESRTGAWQSVGASHAGSASSRSTLYAAITCCAGRGVFSTCALHARGGWRPRGRACSKVRGCRCASRGRSVGQWQTVRRRERHTSTDAAEPVR
jgi:hypothetical protein